MPHSTVELAAWSVVQTISALVGLVQDTLIAVSSGAGGGGGTGAEEQTSALPAPWHVAWRLLARSIGAADPCMVIPYTTLFRSANAVRSNQDRVVGDVAIVRVDAPLDRRVGRLVSSPNDQCLGRVGPGHANRSEQRRRRRWRH